MTKKFYITTTLPYVNAEPHIGFALEIVQADVIARYHQALGEEVFFNTGTDEHGLKIYQAAQKEGKEVQKYCDEYAAKFDALKEALDLSYNNFIRTTDKHHLEAAQEFWQRCDTNGDIYKKNYKIKYCVGCELEKTDSELMDGKCLLHPNQKIEIIEEENYFFKWSNYQKRILRLYDEQPDFVVPNYRFNEIKEFVKRGLQDFSISRLKAKMPWGVPVPNDETQVMYVWFDALVNYISAIGWPASAKATAGKPAANGANIKEKINFNDWWPAVQIAGKDNLRQQSAMWQAMLMSAGLQPSKQIIIHGFVTNHSEKMSKSLGNTINPIDLVKNYGTDAVRYYLLKHFNPFEDSDFTLETFKAVYNADLANGLGNLVARVSQMIEKNLSGNIDEKERDSWINGPENMYIKINKLIENYNFKNVLEEIMKMVGVADWLINEKQPWKGSPDSKQILSRNVGMILAISKAVKVFLPETAEAIEKQFTAKKIKKAAPLFPRI